MSVASFGSKPDRFQKFSPSSSKLNFVCNNQAATTCTTNWPTSPAYFTDHRTAELFGCHISHQPAEVQHFLKQHPGLSTASKLATHQSLLSTQKSSTPPLTSASIKRKASLWSVLCPLYMGIQEKKWKARKHSGEACSLTCHGHPQLARMRPMSPMSEQGFPSSSPPATAPNTAA